MTTVATGAVVSLPTDDGGLRPHRVGPRSDVHDFAGGPPRTRTVFAAAHVVADPLRGLEAVDWEATMAFRRHLWSLGLGVADAMDTAQRGGGLDWQQAKQLIERSGSEARSVGGALACGAMTDQLPTGRRPSLSDIVGAYVEQAGWIRQAGGTPVLMASRHLAAVANGADDFRHVYDEVLRQMDGPVMLHWLGEAFDPLMSSYWGSSDLDRATETVLSLVASHREVVSGIKVSLLDESREIDLRRRLPAGVRMFTGDDFNYDRLILGDERGHSEALLGAFDAVAAPARAALAKLDEGDEAGYRALLEPTIPLARHIFQTPTSAYKTGVVFLAWLNGHQDHFHMIGGAQVLRSVRHLADVFRLADEAGALSDPDLAVHRMREYLALAGIRG